MKKVNAFLIIGMMLCSLLIFPSFTENVDAIGQHEASSGTTEGTIEFDVPGGDKYATYYFDGYDSGGEEWAFSPGSMVNGNYLSYAFTSTDGDIELLNSTNCTGVDLGTIKTVELRVYATYVEGIIHEIILRPVFSETNDGDNHVINIVGTEWTSWQDITTDTNAPSTWSWSNVTNLDCDVETNIAGDGWLYCGQVDLRVTYILGEEFNVTRTTGALTEQNNFTFPPTSDYIDNVTFKIPVSSDVRGIVNVTNNTCGNTATEVNASGELINNTFWYDSANQFVYIRTINLTTSMTVNWTVNCSYGTTFAIQMPQYLEVGGYFMATGTIRDSDDNLMINLLVTTRILYQNGSDAIDPAPEWNCTGGNYYCVISTTSLLPGIYSVSIEFEDPTTGIVFKYGKTLYLSWSPESGVYSDAILHVRWYNTNLGLGLPEETLQLYVDNEIQYNLDYYTYIGEELNVTVKDFYDFVLYTNIFTIDKTNYPLNLGLTFHEYDFSNSNDEYYVVSFLKSGANRWYEKIVPAYGHDEFLLPTGDYTIRVYNADNSSYVSWSATVNASRGYLIAGVNITQVIEGLSVVTGQILEMSNELDYALAPDIEIICYNPPMIYSIFDKQGMAIGNGIYKICPALIVIATTKVETTGNWINSTAAIPSNDTVENGTITILEDTLYLSGSATWVNITYTDNDTLMQNTTYVPTKVNLYGQNITINASGDINILRETQYNQYKKFYWTYNSFTGEHTAGIDVINPMTVAITDVYVYVEFANTSTPDVSTVQLEDEENGVMLDRGQDYDVTLSGIHFYLLSITSDTTRGFTITYYKSFDDSYRYGEGKITIPMYEETLWNGDSYNTFIANWINEESTIFRGGLYLKLDFDISTAIDFNSIRIWDEDNNQEIDSSHFVFGSDFIRIGADGVGDVNPGGRRSFTAYFLFQDYLGADPTDVNLNTPVVILNGVPITYYLIFIIIGLLLTFIGFCDLIFCLADKKNIKRAKVILFLGVFITFIFVVINGMGA